MEQPKIALIKVNLIGEQRKNGQEKHITNFNFNDKREIVLPFWKKEKKKYFIFKKINKKKKLINYVIVTTWECSMFRWRICYLLIQNGCSNLITENEFIKIINFFQKNVS